MAMKAMKEKAAMKKTTNVRAKAMKAVTKAMKAAAMKKCPPCPQRRKAGPRPSSKNVKTPANKRYRFRRMHPR